MTTQHTPGPWQLNRVPWPTTSISISLSPNDNDVDAAFVEGANMEANARLIAAAPELLAALQEARDYLADLLNSKDDEVIDNLINNGEEVESRLSAAIAKAVQPTQQP